MRAIRLPSHAVSCPYFNRLLSDASWTKRLMRRITVLILTSECGKLHYGSAGHVDDVIRKFILDSKMLASAAYDAEKQILHPRFRKTGDEYRYFEFPATKYQAFLDAESSGRFLLAHIRDRFPYERLAKPHAAGSRRDGLGQSASDVALCGATRYTSCVLAATTVKVCGAGTGSPSR